MKKHYHDHESTKITCYKIAVECEDIFVGTTEKQERWKEIEKKYLVKN